MGAEGKKCQSSHVLFMRVRRKRVCESAVLSCPVLAVVWRICVASTYSPRHYLAPLRRSKRGALWTCSSSRMRAMHIRKLAMKIHHRVSATISDKRHRTITDLCSCTCSATTRSGKWSNDSALWTSVVWLECSGRSDG